MIQTNKKNSTTTLFLEGMETVNDRKRGKYACDKAMKGLLLIVGSSTLTSAALCCVNNVCEKVKKKKEKSR